MRTQVAIIGAGPAGLLLGHILRRAGVDFVLLEQGSVDILRELGLDADLAERGLTHHGIHLQYEGRRHHLDFVDLVGRTVTVYGQQALVRHLLAEHDRVGSDIRFETAGVVPHGLDTDTPFVTTDAGERIECEIVVGADGYHGVCRAAIPGIQALERSYPYAWLGIMAEVAPSTDDLIYALHPDGFAMHSMRSREVSRLYLQVDPDESVDDWSDARIWEALQTRLGVPGWTLKEGAITEKSITPMRSFVASTLEHGRLFLAGDAGHIVPPTGAKGMNLAVADVWRLARALDDFFHRDSEAGLRGYSEAALKRIWRAEHFSYWMTRMLHRLDDATPFEQQMQRAELEYVVSSRAASLMLAENYVGLPLA